MMSEAYRVTYASSNWKKLNLHNSKNEVIIVVTSTNKKRVVAGKISKIGKMEMMILTLRMFIE